MTFASRQEAGRKLGCHLLDRHVRPDIVLGLPRGGVIVAAEVAKLLQCPIDVLIVRKIGHPQFREFAVGALAEAGVVVLDKHVFSRARVESEELDAVIAEESKRLAAYQGKFERRPRLPLADKVVVIVDDGLATGATTEAAVQSARKQRAKRVLVAVPVASQSGFARLSSVSDEVIALIVDPHFQAVGQYYWSFPQASDEEVTEVLGRTG